jgi:hypothetical protein
MMMIVLDFTKALNKKKKTPFTELGFLPFTEKKTLLKS